MSETPRRMVHAYAEMLAAGSFAVTTFANAEGYDELVVGGGEPRLRAARNRPRTPCPGHQRVKEREPHR